VDTRSKWCPIRGRAGFTPLTKSISPATAAHLLLNRFYSLAANVVVAQDALV